MNFIEKIALREINFHSLEHASVLMGSTIVRRILVNYIIIIDVSKVFLRYIPGINVMPLVLVYLLSLIISLSLNLPIAFGFFLADRKVRSVPVVFQIITSGTPGCRFDKIVDCIDRLILIFVNIVFCGHIDLGQSRFSLLVNNLVSIIL